MYITSLSIDTIKNDNEATNSFLSKNFKGDILLIAPGYPKAGSEYAFAFINTRVRAYQKLGWKVDVAIVNHEYVNKTASYTFEGVNVNQLSYNSLRLLLQNQTYEKIFVHFFSPEYAQILDASDTTKTQIFIYTHGADVLYKDYPYISRQYFKERAKVTKELEASFSLRDDIVSRYNNLPNVHWFFVSNFSKNRSEELLGKPFKQAHIVPNLIDEKVFEYKERSAEDRKKICVIRPFNNLSSYSVDISVRIILELSKRPLFKDLEFNIYGDGDTHQLLVEPLLKFKNVNIHKKFLNHDDMSDMYHNHGIALFPSRYDTQGAAACEAAMSGAVVLSSDGNIGTKEYISPSLGTYHETENFREYADQIEQLYNNKDQFLNLSKKMHDSVLSTCGQKHSIDRENEIILNIKPFQKKLTFKPKTSKPTLTIAVPSYNVERYLKNGIISLIDHSLAHKLEILIINDGSKDKTNKIGLALERMSSTKNGPIVKIINKENGGHGSTINRGIELATGKYFRLMDGDDYFITDNLVKLVEKLDKETSDIILTNYIEDFSIDAIKRPVRHYEFMTPGIKYDLDVMQYNGYGFGEWGPLLSTTTCRTEILKKANFKIDENCFYVDMEYNFIIYALAQTVTYYPLDIYNYYLGRLGQSMSRESFTRNVLHHEKVTIRLLEEFYARKDSLSDGKKQYLVNKIIIPMCKTQYMITTEYYNTSDKFQSFDKKFKKYEEFYNNREIAGRIIRAHRSSRGKSIRAHSTMKKTAKFIKQR